MNNFLVNTRELTTKQWAFDILLAIAIFVFGIVQLYLTSASVMVRDEGFRDLIGYVSIAPSFSAFAGLALISLPLAFRRRFSWPVYIFVMVSFLGLQEVLRGYSLTIVGPMVALFSVASERPRAEAAVATILGVWGVFVGEAPALSHSLDALVRLQNITSLVVSALAGYAVKTRGEYLRETEQRALEAERSREGEAARRVEAERLRIAREVHDITAHSLVAVSVQAAAAQGLIGRDPEAAKEAIVLVRTTAKEALEEIRSMIAVVRDGDSEDEIFPTQGTDRLLDIVDYLRAASIEVVVDDSRFDKTQIPAYIDVALFRIAREATTNILRHAQASSVTIRLMSNEGSVGLSIEDDGVGRSAEEAAVGHGIQGMEERVRLLGGTFESYSRVNKGFVVRVEIPLGKRDQA